MKFQVKRTIVATEYATMSAESHEQAADMLSAGMWGEVTTYRSNHDTVYYEVNGVPVKSSKFTEKD